MRSQKPFKANVGVQIRHLSTKGARVSTPDDNSHIKQPQPPTRENATNHPETQDDPFFTSIPPHRLAPNARPRSITSKALGRASNVRTVGARTPPRPPLAAPLAAAGLETFSAWCPISFNYHTASKHIRE